METFDEIFILDLHGNYRKQETALDGSKDENVFDIMQGVSINIFVKKKQSVIASEARKGEVEGSLARVYHYELFGKRFEKYAFLADTPFKDIKWKKLNPQGPQYFFVPKDFSVQIEYEKGFKIDELMLVNTAGIKTSNDKLNICNSKIELQTLVSDFQILDESGFKTKYEIERESSDWSYANAKEDVVTSMNNGVDVCRNLSYRPFDVKYVPYTGKANGIMSRPRYGTMRHLLYDNIALNTIRVNRDYLFAIFATNTITDKTLLSSKDDVNVFPLYLYPTEGEEKLGETRKPNLDEKIWSKIDKSAKLKTTPEQVFDYIYGVLHTPSYREKYKEFLKIDFPRIPYPENKEDFERIVSIGNKLHKLHLMEEIPPQATSFNIEGDNVVNETRFEKEKVFINKTQYFANVPELAWNFYIGGYQPAQKWLKDRKNRTLTYDDISHYRKIIAILLETHKLMLELDKK